MNNLKSIIGKSIMSVVKDYSGKNSYVIIKFKEGGKVNIVAKSSSDGISQISLVLSNKIKTIIVDKRLDMLNNKVIKSTEEIFDGAKTTRKITFEDGSDLKITAVGSDENNLADLSIDVYESYKYFVKESLYE
jgi:hypothetical protein